MPGEAETLLPLPDGHSDFQAGFRLHAKCSDATLRSFFCSLSNQQLRLIFKLYLQQAQRIETTARQSFNCLQRLPNDEKALQRKAHQTKLRQHNDMCRDLTKANSIMATFRSYFSAEECCGNDSSQSKILRKCSNIMIWAFIFSFLPAKSRRDGVHVCRFFSKCGNKPIAISEIYVGSKFLKAIELVCFSSALHASVLRSAVATGNEVFPIISMGTTYFDSVVWSEIPAIVETILVPVEPCTACVCPNWTRYDHGELWSCRIP